MAFWSIKNVSLRGVTGTVPNNPVKSADLPVFTQEDADTFDKTVGIRNRYIAPTSICASDLCQDAGERLLAALGWEKQSVDVLSRWDVVVAYMELLSLEIFFRPGPQNGRLF